MTEKCGGIKQKFWLINYKLFMKHCYFLNILMHKLYVYVNVKTAVV